MANHTGTPVLEFDVIADRYRAIEQNNNAGYKIGGDRLQADTDTDPERAAKHRKRGQVDSHDLHQQQENDEKHTGLQQLGGDLARTQLEFFLAMDDVAAGPGRDSTEPEQQRAEDSDPRNAIKRYVDIANAERNRFEIRTGNCRDCVFKLAPGD